MKSKIYHSPPHMGGDELDLVTEAFETNWLSSVGPHLDAFEKEFCAVTGAANAVAVSSGTAALHLSLVGAGIARGSVVLVPSFTFCATINPVLYCGATPVLVDCDANSWCSEFAQYDEAVSRLKSEGVKVGAILATHLYGLGCDIHPIRALCQKEGIVLIEDAAESLGSVYNSASHPGTIGEFGAYSFNGNKIITTTGGGMVACRSTEKAALVRKLATQAREPVTHYLHTLVGFNYRLSNVLAAIGRGQLRVLDDRVRRRREIFELYVELLRDAPVIQWQSEPSWGSHTRWHTCGTLRSETPVNPDMLMQGLSEAGIDARHLWNPLHTHPAYAHVRYMGGTTSETLFLRGFTLPSGSSLTNRDVERVADNVRSLLAPK